MEQAATALVAAALKDKENKMENVAEDDSESESDEGKFGAFYHGVFLFFFYRLS